MIDYKNAESLRTAYLSNEKHARFVNVCTAKRNWNGCDYCDVYSGRGLECWKQGTVHNCVHCVQVERGAK
jgi:hypothetical protein